MGIVVDIVSKTTIFFFQLSSNFLDHIKKKITYNSHLDNKCDFWNYSLPLWYNNFEAFNFVDVEDFVSEFWVEQKLK